MAKNQKEEGKLMSDQNGGCKLKDVNDINELIYIHMLHYVMSSFGTKTKETF
jgi:hypothetical protein